MNDVSDDMMNDDSNGMMIIAVILPGNEDIGDNSKVMIVMT